MEFWLKNVIFSRHFNRKNYIFRHFNRIDRHFHYFRLLSYGKKYNFGKVTVKHFFWIHWYNQIFHQTIAEFRFEIVRIGELIVLDRGKQIWWLFCAYFQMSLKVNFFLLFQKVKNWKWIITNRRGNSIFRTGRERKPLFLEIIPFGHFSISSFGAEIIVHNTQNMAIESVNFFFTIKLPKIQFYWEKFAVDWIYEKILPTKLCNAYL